MASLWFSLLLAGVLLRKTTAFAESKEIERTLFVTAPGGRVVLPCPSEVQHWTLLQQQEETIISLDAHAPQEFSNYFCTGAFVDGSQGHCKYGIRLNSTHGSPLVIYNSTIDHAGIYSCNYEPPGSEAQEKGSEITIITYNALKLHYDPEGAKPIPGGAESTQVNSGSVLALSCVYLFTGFTDPGAELVLKHSIGDRRVLHSIAQKSQNSFVSNGLSEVAAEYVIGEHDGDFDVKCVINNLAATSIPTLHFGGPKSAAASASGMLSDIVLGALVAALALIVISVIVVIVLHIRRKRQKRRDQRVSLPPAPPPASAKPKLRQSGFQLPEISGPQLNSPSNRQWYSEDTSDNPSARPLIHKEAIHDVILHPKHRPHPGQRGDQVRRPKVSPPPAPRPAPPYATPKEEPEPVYENIPDHPQRT